MSTTSSCSLHRPPLPSRCSPGSRSSSHPPPIPSRPSTLYCRRAQTTPPALQDCARAQPAAACQGGVGARTIQREHCVRRAQQAAKLHRRGHHRVPPGGAFQAEPRRGNRRKGDECRTSRTQTLRRRQWSASSKGRGSAATTVAKWGWTLRRLGPAASPRSSVALPDAHKTEASTITGD